MDRANESQFLKAFDEYADALFRHCFFRVSDRETAKDLVHETFTRTWDHLARGKEVREYRAFLYRTANNLIVDFYRKKKAVFLEEISDAEKNTLFYDERGEKEVQDDARRVLSEIKKHAFLNRAMTCGKKSLECTPLRALQFMQV